MLAFCFSCTWVVCLILHSVLQAQQSNDVAHWLDQDTALLINVTQPAETIRRVRKLDLFSNPRFHKALQMLSDERFPILTADATDDVVEQLAELEDLLANVDQISLAVHAIDNQQFCWTLFLRSNSDALTKLSEQLLGVDELLKRSIQLGSDSVTETDAETDGDGNAENESTDVGDLGWCRIGMIDNCLVLSSQPAAFEQLQSRSVDAKFSSLGKSRKYQAIALRESGLDSVPGRISIYGNPIRLKFFMPWITEDRWKRYAILDLPSCGLTFALIDPDEQENANAPIALIDAIAKYTEPAVGYAKLFQQYRPIEIPQLAVDPFELTVFARDETAFAAELARSFDQEHGAGAAEEFWKQHFSQTTLDVNRDALPRREAFVEARYVNINDPQGRNAAEVITLDKVLDFSAAERYATGVIEFGMKIQNRKFQNEVAGTSQWWLAPNESFAANTGLNGLDRQNNTRVDLVNGLHDAYVLTDQWWIQGDMPAVQQQIDLMASSAGQDFSQSIRELQDDLQHRFSKCSPPVMISYFTERAWEENVNQIEDQYAMVNGTKQNVTFTFSGSDGNTIRLEQLFGGESSGTVQLDGNIILQGLDNTEDKPAEKSEGNAARSGNLVMQMVTPMPLGERNEDGYRLELKRREDLQKAIEVMFWKSVIESFPRQLLLYSQGEASFRLIAGVYGNEDTHEQLHDSQSHPR